MLKVAILDDYQNVSQQFVDLKKLSSEKDFFTGLGYWTRANCEQCILGTIGNPKRKNKDVKRLIIDKRREHSRKP